MNIFPWVQNAEDYPNLPFKLANDSFTYLGIKATKSYYSLFKSNFFPLLEQCKNDIKQWSILPLSLIGRTNTVKMNIVPKFLYLFQAIPTFIPQSFLKHQSISSFIWNNKPARIRKEIMERPKDLGGLSLPTYTHTTGLQILMLCPCGLRIGMVQHLHGCRSKWPQADHTPSQLCFVHPYHH